jgi:hypothetical protein
MKTKTLAENSGCFEFSFPRSDTLASVACTADEVVIRTSRDALTEERKAAFVRELASEGFIPDHYQWLFAANDRTAGRIRWLVDPRWWMPGAEVTARTSRFVARVFASAALLWLGLMAMVLCGAAR